MKFDELPKEIQEKITTTDMKDKEVRDSQTEDLASYWYNRYCQLVTEPTAEKAYYVEKLKEAEGKIKYLEAEIASLKYVIDTFKFKTL